MDTLHLYSFSNIFFDSLSINKNELLEIIPDRKTFQELQLLYSLVRYENHGNKTAAVQRLIETNILPMFENINIRDISVDWNTYKIKIPKLVLEAGKHFNDTSSIQQIYQQRIKDNFLKALNSGKSLVLAGGPGIGKTTIFIKIPGKDEGILYDMIRIKKQKIITVYISPRNLVNMDFESKCIEAGFVKSDYFKHAENEDGINRLEYVDDTPESYIQKKSGRNRKGKIFTMLREISDEINAGENIIIKTLTIQSFKITESSKEFGTLIHLTKFLTDNGNCLKNMYYYFL